MTQQGLDLAVIGNCRTAALVEPSARIVWWCFPRFDGDPVFCRLLAGDEEKGFSDVLLDRLASVQSEYVRNTPIVSTILTAADGVAVCITPFPPRFLNFCRVTPSPPLVPTFPPGSRLPRLPGPCPPLPHYTD